MKIVVFSFLRAPGASNFQVFYDEGDGWKNYEKKVEGSYFTAMIDSPIAFVNSYLATRDGKVIQVVEEDGYEHFRMYLEVSSDAAQFNP